MRLPLLHLQPVEQPLKLPSALPQRPRPLRRPSKPPALQAAIVQPKPVVVPKEDLELVPPPIAKDKKTWRERVQVERLAHQRRKPVDRAPQIGASHGEVDVLHATDAQHAALSAFTTQARSSGSNPRRTSIDARPMR